MQPLDCPIPCRFPASWNPGFHGSGSWIEDCRILESSINIPRFRIQCPISWILAPGYEDVGIQHPRIQDAGSKTRFRILDPGFTNDGVSVLSVPNPGTRMIEDPGFRIPAYWNTGFQLAGS
jgi:hypothetical protein